MNKLIFLFIIIILALGIPIFFNVSNIFEGYSNYQLNQSIGLIPNSETEVLLQDTYPLIEQNKLSNNNSSDMWWHFPIFKLGSYKQITNNIKYPNNPDQGTCMPGSLCGALYHEEKKGNNIIYPLPPVDSYEGTTRIGYFTTNN